MSYGAHEDQYSPDATRIAIAYGERCKILNLTSGNVESELERYLEQGLADYSSSGMIISRFSKDKSKPQTAFLWNATDGRIAGSIDAINEDCIPMFSPDGKRIVGVFPRGLVIWDSSNLEQIGKVDIQWPKEKWLLGLLAWNPTNQELAVVNGEGRVLRIDLLQQTATPLLRDQEEPMKSVRWSQDGTRLITIRQEDGSVLVWDVQTGTLLTRIQEKDVGYAFFSADGTQLVTSAHRIDVVRKERPAPRFWDRSTKVWDTKTGSLVRELPTIGIVTFSDDWKFIVETGPEGLRIARFDGSESCAFPNWFDGHGSSSVFAPDNSYLASVNGSGRVAIWRHRASERFWIDCITGYHLWIALLALIALGWAIAGFARMPVPLCSRPRSIKRRLKRITLIAVSMLAVGAAAFGVVARNYIRSIWSIQRIPNTKMYVMDYYAPYNLEELAKSGTDPNDVEGSLFRALLPDLLIPIAEMISGHKRGDRDWHTSRHSCSSISLATEDGNVLFGRNFDWSHDPCLVVRVHGATSSVAVLDLHYLKLDEAKLADLSLKDRLNLLFAPYLAEDGMNEYGLAVSSMAADESDVPFDSEKPTVIKPLLKRLILDQARTTVEAINLIQNYNVDFAGTPCHFMIADRSGESVVVEFIKGETSIVSSTKPWQIATNHLITGNTDQMNREKCSRFNTALEAFSHNEAPADSDLMMQVMSSIAVENWTMWSSVYDLKSGAYQVAYRRQYEDVFKGQLKGREP